MSQQYKTILSDVLNRCVVYKIPLATRREIVNNDLASEKATTRIIRNSVNEIARKPNEVSALQDKFDFLITPSIAKSLWLNSVEPDIKDWHAPYWKDMLLIFECRGKIQWDTDHGPMLLEYLRDTVSITNAAYCSDILAEPKVKRLSLDYPNTYLVTLSRTIRSHGRWDRAQRVKLDVERLCNLIYSLPLDTVKLIGFSTYKSLMTTIIDLLKDNSTLLFDTEANALVTWLAHNSDVNNTPVCMSKSTTKRTK